MGRVCRREISKRRIDELKFGEWRFDELVLVATMGTRRGGVDDTGYEQERPD